MKSRYELLIIMLVISIPELYWYQAHADQQATKDDAENYANTLVNGVQNLTSTTSANTIPGFSGTNLPETSYYDNQDLNGMQTDAAASLSSGTASDVGQYAYQQSLLPKLQFGANDPILLNSSTVSTDAMTNPDVLTVQTGSCDVTDVTTPVTSIETCTSYINPTVHNCANTLNVDVTWDSVSSCPVGTGFSQVQALHNASGINDYVYGRAYCNPGSGENAVDIQVDASDGDTGDCSGWTGITVSTNQATQIYTGVTLRPRFAHYCAYLPTFVQGSCDAANACDYTITYHELSSWFYSDGDSICNNTPNDLVSKGYTGMSNYQDSNLGSLTRGLYCTRSSSVNITFEKPNITQTPTVTDTWSDSCGLYEAQVQ